MLLKLTRFNCINGHCCKKLKTRHYFATKAESTLNSQQRLELVRKQEWFQSYQNGTKYYLQKNYPDSLKHFYKVIQTMQQKNQKGQAYYYQIFQKILKLTVILNRPLEAEQNFYKLIKVKKALQKNPILVYQDYQNLMIHQLSFNVEKAITLGKALLSESQLKNLPINNQKYIRMLLGNGYLLIDNYPDAKKKYGQVLQMNPNHTLKGIVLNNLSIASWWHKNPMFALSATNQQVIKYEQVRINRDFKQTKQLLMNSIGALENIEQLSEKNAHLLQSLLNENAENMLAFSSTSKNEKQLSSNIENLVYPFSQRLILKPIYNLIQYYIYNDPIQKNLITAWMRILLKATSKFNDSYLIDQITSKYYLLNNQVIQLNKLLKQSIQKYEKQLSAERKSLKLKIHLLQSYKMASVIQKIRNQGKNIQNSTLQQIKLDQNKIKMLEKQILQKDKFAFKRQFILTQQISFMKDQQ